MRNHLLVFIIFPLFALACEALKNRTDHIAIECGLPQKNVSHNSYIKLLASSGTGYESSDLASLKVRFLLDNGKEQPIALTPRACLSIPNEKGLLQVVDTRDGDSLAKKLESGLTSNSLTSLFLITKPEFQASLACPDEGIFASDTLKQPLFINTTEISGLDIRLDLLTPDNKFIKTMFRKSMGQPEIDLPDSIDVRDVSEGSYLLKIYGHHLSEGIDSRPLLLSSEKVCKFHVLRGNVYVAGLESDTGQLVFPPRSRLPWTINNPFEKLFVCRENRSNTSSGLPLNRESCQAQSTCLDPSNFKEANQINTEGPGVFDYFVYAENKAGRRSHLSCQTIVVSDAPPSLAVTWAHEDLKKPGSILRNPYAVLKADIETDHRLIQSVDIENNLSCKVDFEIKGNNSYTEKGVYCTEGRCKGQSLADYVPCDKHIEFSIVNALNQPMLLSSRLRLSVRSTDGAGHSAEAQASVWINQSIWAQEALDYEFENQKLNISNFLIDPSGDVLATFVGATSDQLATFTFSSGRWFELKPDNTGAFQYKLARGRDGSLRIARTLRYGETFKVDVYGYKHASLVPIAVTQEDNQIPACWEFLIGPNDSIYCMGLTANEVAQLIDKRWVRLPPAIEATAAQPAKSVQWRILANGDIAAVSTTELLIWNGQSWSQQSFTFDGDLMAAPDLIEDFKGRLWLYGKPKEKEYGIYKVEQDRLVPYPSPAKLTQIFTEIAHPSSSEGLSFFLADMYIFNFSSDKWEPASYPIGLMQDLEDRHPMINDSKNAFILLGNKGFFEYKAEPLYWPTKSLGFDSRTPGQSIERDKNVIYFIDNSKANNKSRLVRIKPSFVSSFESNMTGSGDSHATGSWKTPEGHTVLNFYDGTQLYIVGDHIEKRRAPDQFKEALQVSALPSGGFCIARLSGYWIYKPTRDIYRNIASDEGTGRQQQCTEDRLGRIWWWDYFANTLNFHDGDRSHQFNLPLMEGEKIKTLMAPGGPYILIVATNSRIFHFGADYSLQKILTIQDLSGDVSANIDHMVLMNDHEVMVQAENSEKKKLFLSINLEKGTSALESDFKRIVGEFPIQRSSQWQGVTYILTRSPRAVVMQRTAGKWKKLGNSINDYRHALLNKVSTPWWFAADDAGHLWFIASPTPYTFGRIDPEFAP